MSGSSFGTCVTLPLAGLIAEELGWEAVFYITGKDSYVTKVSCCKATVTSTINMMDFGKTVC